jgi:2-polyprenyl-6-methoxyphenol hydroxylase-like FAD-dependent oxidoreductase
MVESTYDAVIVGGRCAGAALATYLARAGASVIVLEADPLGTDQVISTHTIHPAGVDVLNELGVGTEVLSESPPARVIRFQVEDVFVDVRPPEGRYECCPRRYRLDRLLQNAALDAGAEICERTRVTRLLWDGSRVIGALALQAGHEIEVRGAITVGADGRRSTVARLVGAREYLGYDAPRAMYWAYWDPPDDWNSPTYPYDVLIRFSGTDRRVVFTTDRGQLLIATLPFVDVARRWKSDLQRRYLDDLCADPDLELLVTQDRKVSKTPEMSLMLFRETEYDVNPYKLLPVSKVALSVLGAVVRGHPRLILDFIAQGRRTSAVMTELKERQKLLDAVG